MKQLLKQIRLKAWQQYRFFVWWQKSLVDRKLSALEMTDRDRENIRRCNLGLEPLERGRVQIPLPKGS